MTGAAMSRAGKRHDAGDGGRAATSGPTEGQHWRTKTRRRLDGLMEANPMIVRRWTVLSGDG